MGVDRILVYSSTFSALVPLLFGLPNFFRSNPIILKLLCILTAVSFLADVSSFVLIRVGVNPNYAGSSYQFLEFYLLTFIYYQAFLQPSISKILILAGLIFCFFSLLDLLYLQHEGINSYTKSFSAIFFIVLSIAYFYQLLRDMPSLQIHHLPMFWINAAVLFYFAGNFFLFILSDYLIKVMNNNLIVYWSFHNLVNVIKNVLFAVGMAQRSRTV
jgi:hypothetical protein